MSSHLQWRIMVLHDFFPINIIKYIIIRNTANKNINKIINHLLNTLQIGMGIERDNFRKNDKFWTFMVVDLHNRTNVKSFSNNIRVCINYICVICKYKTVSLYGGCFPDGLSGGLYTIASSYVGKPETIAFFISSVWWMTVFCNAG